MQADGKVLIGGSFTQVGGIARNRIARLNTDGSLDLSFDLDVNDRIETITLQPNGDILIGGAFTNVGGVARNRVALLDAAGAIDMNFNPDINGTVKSIAIQVDGKILVGGSFTGIGQFIRSRLAGLEADGSLDSNYNPIVGGSVEQIGLQDDGKAIVVGDFIVVSDPFVQRRGIARFNDNGSLDRVFNAELSSRAVGLALQDDGKILVGGRFRKVASSERGRIARLDADGSLEQLLDSVCIPLVAKNGAITIVCL